MRFVHGSVRVRRTGGEEWLGLAFEPLATTARHRGERALNFTITYRNESITFCLLTCHDGTFETFGKSVVGNMAHTNVAKLAAAPNFVVDSSQGFDHIRAQIRDILRKLATMRRR
jgi:hypothetical protein